MRSRKPSEELEESSSEEDAGFEDKQATDVSEFGASDPPEILSQRGHAVRHTGSLCSTTCLTAFHSPQIAAEQQRSLSPVTPTRQPHIVVSTPTTSGLVSDPTVPVSPFKGSNVFQSPGFDVPSQSPVEKLEAVKQYLRDRADQPLHHVEYVGLVSLLKDSVQGL